ADRDAWLIQAGAANLVSGNAYLLGDANLDGKVDGQDFVIWNSHKFTFNSAWSAADFNADGMVNGGDYIVWNSNKFMQSGPVSAGVTPSFITHRPGREARSDDREAADSIDQLFGQPLAADWR
ncbi:MAG: hypothetical protein AAGF97_16765, partial [Planctomycetota bacterium]